MTPEYFRTRYPSLGRVLDALAGDNGLRYRADLEIPEFLLSNLADYDAQAAQLSDDEKEILAAGMAEDQVDLVARTGFSAMDSFIEEVFDGVLTDIFWNRA